MREVERRTIEGWIQKASNHLDAAREQVKSNYRCSEAVQSAQQCIELSVKAVLSLLHIEYPPAHEWTPEKKAFAAIAQQTAARQLMERLTSLGLNYTVSLPRLLHLMNFWGQFYLTAKYGFEPERLASAGDLFRAGEANLAVQHAEECYRAASTLRYYDRAKLESVIS